MSKKVYFAGSIRGGREDAALYKRIIEYIQKTDIVLTEHVGDLSLSKTEDSTPKDVCLEPENSQVLFSGSEGQVRRDVSIYKQDTNWLRECDVVIAECTTPSLGVGYELAFAEKLGKPVHIFYNKKRCRLSAMLTGDSYFQIHPYKNEEEIYPLIDSILCSSRRSIG